VNVDHLEERLVQFATSERSHRDVIVLYEFFEVNDNPEK